jgi:CRISPR-associated protein Csm1
MLVNISSFTEALMDTKLERLATAALLHDIGKFWSRTGTPKPFTDQEAAHFNDTWKHALWTGRFVEQYLEDGEVASWARKHHSPDSRESYIISLADWLSSGERRADDTQQTGAPESAPLANILSRLRISGEMPENAKGSVLPLTQHGDFDNAPLALSGEATLSKADYEALWKTFAAQAECAGKRPLRHNTWLALMRRFCSRIPAATPTRVGAWVPDISLYDHSRTTAAIASCLFRTANCAEQPESGPSRDVRACMPSRVRESLGYPAVPVYHRLEARGQDTAWAFFGAAACGRSLRPPRM